HVTVAENDFIIPLSGLVERDQPAGWSGDNFGWGGYMLFSARAGVRVALLASAALLPLAAQAQTTSPDTTATAAQD
ncbi:hypothetical protein, partial [Klebsiella pneumoniae]|uniref:hypothetical protein n=1 Tax=Klebsiella pneumoniae TaxID=573 RepID=UPI001952EDB9